MANEGKPYVPSNLNKVPGWFNLQPGDPWTFMRSHLERNADVTMDVEVGGFIHTAFDLEATVCTHSFRVVRCTPQVYEVVYLGPFKGVDGYAIPLTSSSDQP